MSAPATNAFSPAPVRISTPTSGSRPAAATAWSSSSTVRRSRAFSFSGRLIVRRAMRSFDSYRTRPVLVVMLRPSRPGWSSPGDQKIVGARRLHAVVVEPLAGLAAVKAGQHHPLHERRRREAALLELLEHDV